MADTVSYENDEGLPQAKQPRLGDYSVDTEEEFDEDFSQSSSCWLASEQLSAFLETFRKPLQSFERKTICRKFPRPDVEAVYTPVVDEYLSSLVPGIKQANKEGRFTQDHALDAVGSIAFIYEHLNDLLFQSKEKGGVVLPSDQLQALFSASSHGLRLIGNASALLAKERRSVVLKKINAKGCLASLATEDFPDAKKKLFGDGFEVRLKTKSETAKTLLRASNVGRSSQQFFRGCTAPFKFRGGRGVGAFGNPQYSRPYCGFSCF